MILETDIHLPFLWLVKMPLANIHVRQKTNMERAQKQPKYLVGNYIDKLHCNNFNPMNLIRNEVEMETVRVFHSNGNNTGYEMDHFPIMDFNTKYYPSFCPLNLGSCNYSRLVEEWVSICLPSCQGR